MWRPGREHRVAPAVAALVLGLVAMTAPAAGTVAAASGSPSPTTSGVVATIALPDSIVGTLPLYDPLNGNVYVATWSYPTLDGTVTVLSGATNSVVSNVIVGSEPNFVGVNLGNGQVYVENFAPGQPQGNLTVLSGVTNWPVANVAVGPEPYGVAYDPDNGDLYVAANAGNNVNVLSGANGTFVTNVSMPGGPVEVDFDPVNQDLYVFTVGTVVTVVSGITNKVVGSPQVPGEYGEIYPFVDVENGNVDVGTSEGVFVISSATNQVVQKIALPGGDPEFLDGSGELGVLQAGSSAVLSLVSTTTATVQSSIPLGAADWAAYDPANGDIYSDSVAGGGARFAVNVTSLASGQLLQTLAMGSSYVSPPTIDPANGDLYVTAELDHLFVISGEIPVPASSSSSLDLWPWVDGGLGFLVGLVAAAVVVRVRRRRSRWMTAPGDTASTQRPPGREG